MCHVFSRIRRFHVLLCFPKSSPMYVCVCMCTSKRLAEYVDSEAEVSGEDMGPEEEDELD